MELANVASDSLRILGDASVTSVDVFQSVSDSVFLDLTSDGSCHSAGLTGTAVQCHVALSAFILEAVRRDQNDGNVRSHLDNLNWELDRIEYILVKLKGEENCVRSRLASINYFFPHIVDVEWKLSCRSQSSDGISPDNNALYTVTVHTQECGGRNGEVTFCLSLSELTHMVTKLRQATRTVNKFAKGVTKSDP